MSSTLFADHTVPIWLRSAAVAGVGWNVFGIFQFASAVTATDTGLIASGLTPEQASVMTGYPIWMTMAFAVGVFGGLAGSILLFWRHPAANGILAASLAAYVALWIGDAVHGVFAALGAPQITILTVVVAIAAGLWLAARNAGHPLATN